MDDAVRRRHVGHDDRGLPIQVVRQHAAGLPQAEVTSGDAHLESLEARRFAAVLAGSGNLTVAGHAAEQAFKLSGSGDVDAARLEGRGVQVAISGSGDASVNASASLDATVAGSGDVVYRGSPRITQRVRGTGSIQKAR